MNRAVQDEVEYWSTVLVQMKSKETQSYQEWKEHEQQKVELAVQVDLAWEAKIEAMLRDVQSHQSCAAAEVKPAEGVASAGSAPKDVALTVAAGRAPSAMENLKEQKRLNEQRELMDKQQVELDRKMQLADQRQLDTSELSQEVKDYHLSAPWTPMDLPGTIPKPQEGEYEYWITLAQHAQEWREVHECAPCTYGELMGEIKDQSAGMASLVTVIGEDYWRKLYGLRSVLATDVVPCQLALVLQVALTKNRNAAESALGTEATAKSMKAAKAKIKACMEDAANRPKMKMVKRTGGK